MTRVNHITPIVIFKLKTKMLKSSLWDYGDVDILVKGIVTITKAEKNSS